MDILFEDNSIIVIYKPSGIATQTKKVGEKDIVSELKKHLKGGYVGVVHRLDQPVCGLLVFAKNKEAAADLSKQVAAKGEAGFQKDYTAICLRESNCIQSALPCATEQKESFTHGSEQKGSCPIRPEQKDSSHHRLEDYIIKEKEGFARIVSPQEADKYPDAKKAILTYEVLREMKISDELCYRLRVHLETGRFHQIRAQLANAGLPIIGDQKYGNPESKKISAGAGIRQILLCADSLVFRHPATGKTMQFTTEAFSDL